MRGEPYVAIIFTNQRTGDDDDGYLAEAARMDALASEQPGYVDIDSVRDPSGFGITVSYWDDEAAALAWKAHAEHLVAQQRGRSTWYDRYSVRVATVTREYDYVRPICHLALPDEWAAAVTAGQYTMSTRGITLADEGFIHCSFAHQVLGVAQRFYGDVTELVVVRLDRTALDADLRVEPAADGVDELFPHLYAPIPIDAVVTTTAWRRDGQWSTPPANP
jgi:uncharacterized protein (DUF952 family)